MVNNKKKHVLSVFSLVMLNVIAVDNLRSLPISAQYGFSLVFYYLLAGLVFFIPAALVAAELATGWPATGGVYVWVREAFGKKYGFFAIWLQWIYNVVWYPTILAFLAAILAYLIDPTLTQSKFYTLSVILIMFWATTIINIFGMRASRFLSNLGALVGTILPMCFIAALGMIWIGQVKPAQINFSWASFWPDLSNLNNLSFLVAIYFGFIGVEMSAVHAEEVRNPQRDYPRALLYSSLIILGTLIFSSLAIAIVIPHNQISLVSGLIDAFAIFFNAFHLPWMIPLMALLIILGGLSGVSAWILGAAKGLLAASRDGNIPPAFKKLNKYGAPSTLLLTQGVIVTGLSSIFLLMPTVNSSYWVLSALTSQLGLLFYITLFAAAIYLRYLHPKVHRAYTIPGGKFGIWLVGVTGIIACISGIIVGFLPPPNVSVGKVFVFELILALGILIFCAIPFILYGLRKPQWKDS